MRGDDLRRGWVDPDRSGQFAGRWAKALEAPGRGPERGVERGLAEFTQGRCKPIVNGLGCHVADA